MIVKQIGKNKYKRINRFSEFFKVNKVKIWSGLCIVVGVVALMLGWLIYIEIINL